MQPRDYDDIRRFVQRALERRKGLAPGSPFRPSDYWTHFAEHFEYVLRLDEAELRRIRFHGYHLTADGYQKYLFDEAPLRERLARDHAALARELDAFRPDEGECGYGCRVDGLWLSTDLLRYLQVVADLVGAQVLPRDRPARVLEIGGGYGGLAAVCALYNPGIAYAICDLEETQFFQAVHLANRFGFAAVELCEDGLLRDQPLQSGRFYLLPQTRADTLGEGRFDLAINQQSLQEMTQAQVLAYCQRIRSCARYFYSCNLDAHRESVVRRTGIVTSLQQLLDREFPQVHWETSPPRGIARLLGRLRGRRRRTGDRKLRRVVYRI